MALTWDAWPIYRHTSSSFLRALIRISTETQSVWCARYDRAEEHSIAIFRWQSCKNAYQRLVCRMSDWLFFSLRHFFFSYTATVVVIAAAASVALQYRKINTQKRRHIIIQLLLALAIFISILRAIDTQPHIRQPHSGEPIRLSFGYHKWIFFKHHFQLNAIAINICFERTRIGTMIME